jgi:endonuclease G
MRRRRLALALLVVAAGCDLDTAVEILRGAAQEAAREPGARRDTPAPPPNAPAGGAPQGPAPQGFRAGPQVALGPPLDRSPQDEILLVKPQYVLSYNRFRNVANWAAWRLTAADIGDTGRTRDRFAPDPQLPDGVYRAMQGDYRGSGYDRGHLVPSAQRTADPDDNAATFLMTNVLPQRHDLNAGCWEGLEAWSLRMAQEGWDLYTYAGGIYPTACATDRSAEGNSPDPSCPSIGRSDDVARRVGVPTSTWKVIALVPRGGGLGAVTTETPVIAVDMPNDGSATADWHRYVLSVDALEQRTGYDFLTAVNPAVQAVIEARPYRGG